jgi:hypothetical protein
MERSSQSRGAKLSESIHRQVNAYALAASAAGGILALMPPAECVLSTGAALAGVLVLSEPAEAKIVYTATNVVIHCSQSNCHTHRSFDLNHDGIADFEIVEMGHGHVGCGSWVNPLGEGDGVEGRKPKDLPLAFALRAGSAIGGTQPFIDSRSVIMRRDGPEGFETGYWHFYHKNRYLGLKFRIKGKTHFGWARLKTSCGSATLTGYAYETIPGKAIKAGQTHGSDHMEATPDTMDLDDPGPGASLNPIPDKSQPVSLGMLALGAQGFPVWRHSPDPFDVECGIETTQRIHQADLRVDSPNSVYATGYLPSEPATVREILDWLPIHFENFTFIDFGSGKGRVLFVAAERPFKQIIGVEHSPELHRVALSNLSGYHNNQQRCFAIQPVCADMTTFEIPPGPIVLFFYHPASDHIMRIMADRIAGAEQEVYIVDLNLNPRRAVFEERFQRVHLGDEYSVYRHTVGSVRRAV